MAYSYDSLSGAVLLRADSHAQRVNIQSQKGAETSLISEDLFWGKSDGEGLYFPYDSPENEGGYTVSCEGWHDYTEKPTEKMSMAATHEWIKNNILKPGKRNICIIQGYAGCGKTTFVHDILRRVQKRDPHFGYHDFYVGYVDNGDENVYIPSSIQTRLVNRITDVLTKDHGFEIYKTFVGLFQLDLSKISSVFQIYISPIFTSMNDASLYSYAQSLYEHRQETATVNSYKSKYCTQFENAIKAKIHLMCFRSAHQQAYSSLLEALLFIDLFWHCATFLFEGTDSKECHNQIIVFDNLDIIENHQVVANFIDTLRSVLANFHIFASSQRLQFPLFKAILTVRKITYASVSRFVEVSSNEQHQAPAGVDFLDISNLYSSPHVLKHKANILLKNLRNILPPRSASYSKIQNFLSRIQEIPDEIFSDVKFAHLLNHNLRACSNMLEEIISSQAYQTYFLSTSSATIPLNNKCKSAIWVYIMCGVLLQNDVWTSMGYNLSSSNDFNHPTTLARMVLTLLRNQRYACMHDKAGYVSPDVSFEDIITDLEKIPFGSFRRQASWEDEIMPLLQKNFNETNTRERIIKAIAKMLQRNDASEKLELWRRPLFYTRNAFPLSDFKSIHDTLSEQIKSFGTDKTKSTYFCITDEGSTFVETIATHFEFYSIRYNNNVSKPLCCVLDASELVTLISRVYNQVSQCVKKQVWLMNFYLDRYHCDKNEYLNLFFHPRTEDFSPQLHIVRTIYDHIIYLNEYRNYLNKTFYNNESILTPLNQCLVDWIGKYLQLYAKNLYPLLQNTDGAYNNAVWLDLEYLYWIVCKDPKRRGENFLSKESYVAIDRKNATDSITRRNQTDYDPAFQISDEALLHGAIVASD